MGASVGIVIKITRPSELNQFGGGGSRINLNKSKLLSHFSSSFVCFAYTNGNYWGGGLSPAPPPPLPTALNNKIICRRYNDNDNDSDNDNDNHNHNHN